MSLWNNLDSITKSELVLIYRDLTIGTYICSKVPNLHIIRKYTKPIDLNGAKVSHQTHYYPSPGVLLIMLSLQLHLLLFNLALQIMGGILLLASSRDEPRGVGEHVVHLLKRHLLCLRKQSIEEEGVGKIADHKHEIELVLDMLHGDGGDLADHRVEGKRDTSRNGNTLGSGTSVENFGWNDPRKGTASAGEGEIVQPGHDDEAPMGSGVCAACRELRHQDCGNDKGETISKVAANKSPSSTKAIDE